jgi:deoxyribose-phosphate aldolase
MPDLTAVARRALPLVDLTSLTGEEDEDQVVALCRQASTPAGDVAAVCVYPKWVNVCVRELAGTEIRVAAVANFPEGALDVDRALHDTELAREDGADEIDVVLPFEAWLAGDERGALLLVEQVRAELLAPVRLKVILEAGALGDPATVRAAATAALEAGADFVKTSTGKRSPGATPEAARAMLDAIAAHGAGGFKASGGVRTAEDAATYLALADERLGPEWASPDTFRLGASSLVGDLLARLG